MQKAILESRIQFTTLLKVISEEWDETTNNSGRRLGGRVNLDTLGDAQWMDFFRYLVIGFYGNRDWTASVFRLGSTAGVIGGRV
jgi:hypothetical protein